MKVLAISNKIRVVNTNSSQTKIITFSDDSVVYGFYYPSYVGFEQQFRIDLKVSKKRPIESGKTYRTTAGLHLNNNVIIDRQVEMQTDYFDDNTHLALAIASKHKYFAIDGKQYFRNSEYQIEHNDESGDILQLAPAKATLIEQSKGFTNQAC